jgi:hypothetical protein
MDKESDFWGILSTNVQLGSEILEIIVDPHARFPANSMCLNNFRTVTFIIHILRMAQNTSKLPYESLHETGVYAAFVISGLKCSQRPYPVLTLCARRQKKTNRKPLFTFDERLHFRYTAGMGSRTPHSRPRPDKFEAKAKAKAKAKAR